MAEWDVSNVRDMNAMMMGASSFDQPLSGWDVLRCQDTSYMFHGTKMQTQNIPWWFTSTPHGRATSAFPSSA